MSGRFVRASKYRHVFGRGTKKEQCYDNLRISKNAWDTNLVKANPKYISVNWEASGGGAFAVIPVEERGKLPEQLPLFRGHTAAVLDTDWNPFNDELIASGSDDAKVFLWKVPDEFSLHSDAEEPEDVQAMARLSGHSRKVGHVLFNPAAENILASSSGDYTVKLWDVEDGTAALTLKHNDIVQSLSWSANGSMLVTTSRDKKIRFWDVRQQKPAHEVAGHAGAKNSRCVWLGDHDRVATTGFSRMSDRQVGIFDVRNPTKPLGGDFKYLDSISGVCMPFWDDGCQMLYLAGKGDGNIRYYEYENDKIEDLSEYKSADPQRGLAFMPKRGVNTHENEIMRAFKTVGDSYIEPVSFIVPRRAEVFQDDIYPPAVGLKSAVSSGDWLGGKDGMPPKISLESLYEGGGMKEVPAESIAKPSVTRDAPASTPAPASKPDPKTEPSHPTPAISRDQPSMKENKDSMKENRDSMSAMASKFADKDDRGEDAAADEDDSSFEEVQKPVERPTAASAAHQPKQESKSLASDIEGLKRENLHARPTRPPESSPERTNSTPTTAQQSSDTPPSPATAESAATKSTPSGPAPATEQHDEPARAAAPSASSAAEGIKGVLGDIRGMLMAQGKQIESLTAEVAQLKARVGGE